MYLSIVKHLFNLIMSFYFFRRLNNHRDDPNVTEHNSRQYVLFLTPKGALSDDLNEFWKASSEQCGKNSSNFASSS